MTHLPPACSVIYPSKMQMSVHIAGGVVAEDGILFYARKMLADFIIDICLDGTSDVDVKRCCNPSQILDEDCRV